MLRGYADAQLLLYIRAEVAQEADRKLASSIPSVEELGIEELQTSWLLPCVAATAVIVGMSECVYELVNVKLSI